MKQCQHCPEPVEAERYSMCKDCWWSRDPRNIKNGGTVDMEKYKVPKIEQGLEYPMTAKKAKVIAMSKHPVFIGLMGLVSDAVQNGDLRIKVNNNKLKELLKGQIKEAHIDINIPHALIAFRELGYETDIQEYDINEDEKDKFIKISWD